METFPAGTSLALAAMTTVEQGPYDDETDPVEPAGPGNDPVRIQPADAIMPGTTVSRRLMIAWFIRKSLYRLFLGGYAVGRTRPVLDSHDPSNVVRGHPAPAESGDTGRS